MNRFRVELQRVLHAACGSALTELHDKRHSQHRQPDVGRTVCRVRKALLRPPVGD